MSKTPDPKLSIVEEFEKEWHRVSIYSQHMRIKSFLLAALEAHGKAEREIGYELRDKEYADTLISVEEKSHAAGFTEGVEKVIEVVKATKNRPDNTIMNVERERQNRMLNNLLHALEALKHKKGTA